MEASPRSGSTHDSSKLRVSSTFLKHVSLYDWWLIKPDGSPDGQGLGVGGRVSDQQVGLRVFHSAAIVKRRSNDVLETSDGITVTLVGSINRSCTIQNGFSPEVSTHFLFGFPYYWEDYASHSLSDESIDRAPSSNRFLTKLIDELPPALMRDCFVPSSQVSEARQLQRCILQSIERAFGDNDHHKDACAMSPQKGSKLVTSRDSQPHKISSNSSCRRSTRSMSRLKKEGMSSEKKSLPTPSTKNPPPVSVSPSDSPSTHHGENMLNLKLTARRLTLRSHSTRNISCLETRATQEKNNLLPSSTRRSRVKSVPVYDSPWKRSGGYAGEKSTSGATMTTKSTSRSERSGSVDKCKTMPRKTRQR